ncbi:MAG TPA: RNA polymerase sigma factor, partial [Polyangia bacterium]|nr:RNA polymerase sigma factor [Polyangia bacterium]
MTLRRPTPAAGDDSDAALMTRIAQGDGGALGELYDRHQAGLRRFLARASADAADVDDLLHVTFLSAAQIAGRYDGRASCRPWLIGIAAQHLRRRGRALGRLVAVLTSFGFTRARAADDRVAFETRPDLERALRRLSPAKRVAFLMAELEGLSCPEIAAALDVPIGTVWTRLHAARRELRAAL